MSKIDQIYSQSKTPGEFAKKYFNELNSLLSNLNEKDINFLFSFFETARKKGNTIFVAGNGGSATTATTMANDLGFDILKKTSTKMPFKVLALTDNNAVITAIANDVGYENIFIEQLNIHYKKGDALIVISASGNSTNLIKAANWVKKKQGKVFGLLGFSGGKLKKICSSNIHLKTDAGEYGFVEDCHLIINHVLAHWYQCKFKKK